MEDMKTFPRGDVEAQRKDTITIVIEISSETAEHCIREVEIHTDEGSTSMPFPASEEWCEFQNALREGYDKAISETYKLLKNGQVIEAGDEFLDDSCVDWLPITGWPIGRQYNVGFFQPVRRKV